MIENTVDEFIKDIHNAERKANDLRQELKDVQWKMNKLSQWFTYGGATSFEEYLKGSNND
tara:strand:+ start:474 stop:653 length:180 start_codon:yes stop_codon:yes gene_type:complete